MLKKPSKEDVKLATQYINDLEDSDVKKRVAATQNLAFIAKTLGNDRIIKQLIPYLREQIINDETEVVLQVLDEVYKIAKILGGGINSIHLLPLLQDLIQSEQEKIRKKAISQYYQIILICQIKKSQSHIVASLKRVWNIEFIQAREAFAYVVSRELGNFSPANQNQFLANYQAMSENQNVILRKFAAVNSCQLVNWIKVNQPVILKIVEILFKDKQQSNKIYLIDTIIEIAKVKPPTSLQPYFNLISYQFSSRVRYELIAKISFLAEAMGKQNFKAFLTYINKYIKDIQPEIRSISCLKLQQIVNYLEVDDIVNSIIPALKNPTQDTHAFVKHSLASSILYLCKPIGKKNTTDHILPKFLQLLKDEDEQVRMTIFKNVNLICDVLGVDTLSQTTIPALYQLATHNNWRIRAQSIGLFFYFISNSPKQFMDDKNIKLAIDYIRDRAFSVRKQGIKLLSCILKHFQAQWFQKNIMPKLLNIFKATSYLQRETILLTIQSLLPNLSVQYVIKYIYPNVKQLYADEVQNVRLSSLQTLKVMCEVLPKQKDVIKKMIKKMATQDGDKDVREYAQKTLSEIE